MNGMRGREADVRFLAVSEFPVLAHDRLGPIAKRLLSADAGKKQTFRRADACSTIARTFTYGHSVAAQSIFVSEAAICTTETSE